MSGRLRRTARRARAMWRLEPRVRGRTIEMAATLTLARLLVRTMPLHAIARRLANQDGRAGALDTAEDALRLLPAVARAMPFRAQCLEQALAAAMMLRRRRIAATLHLGTTRGAPGGAAVAFEAHAWITVDGTVIVGGPIDRYVELTRF